MLLECFPQPRPVILQGRLRIAAQLKVADLVQLDAFLAAQAGDPFAELARCAGDERRKALRRAYNAAEQADGVAPIETAEGRERLFTSIDGAATFLLLVLRDDPDPPSATEAQDLTGTLTADEWLTLERIAFGLDALDELGGLIDDEIGLELPPPQEAPRSSRRRTWRHVLFDLCRQLHYTPDQVGALYLTQLRILTHGGDRERGEELPTGMSLDEYREKLLAPRAAFWAEAEKD
jgi:hypothetical protein